MAATTQVRLLVGKYARLAQCKCRPFFKPRKFKNDVGANHVHIAPPPMAVAIRTQRNIGVRLLMLQAGHPMVNSICNIHDSTARHTHIDQCLDIHQIRDSIVVSISACHAEDPGSIPGRGIILFPNYSVSQFAYMVARPRCQFASRLKSFASKPRR